MVDNHRVGVSRGLHVDVTVNPLQSLNDLLNNLNPVIHCHWSHDGSYIKDVIVRNSQTTNGE
jgi:hypothetical protein